MDEVTIIVPSSSANLGLGYDTWSLGISEPHLKVTYTKISSGIELNIKSSVSPPLERVLGTAGRKALEEFLKQEGIEHNRRDFKRIV